jgi:hypothetical protein
LQCVSCNSGEKGAERGVTGSVAKCVDEDVRKGGGFG